MFRLNDRNPYFPFRVQKENNQQSKSEHKMPTDNRIGISEKQQMTQFLSDGFGRVRQG